MDRSAPRFKHTMLVRVAAPGERKHENARLDTGQPGAISRVDVCLDRVVRRSDPIIVP
jgi:hypothetical protein